MNTIIFKQPNFPGQLEKNLFYRGGRKNKRKVSIHRDLPCKDLTGEGRRLKRGTGNREELRWVQQRVSVEKNGTPKTRWGGEEKGFPGPSCELHTGHLIGGGVTRTGDQRRTEGGKQKERLDQGKCNARTF